MPHSVRLAKIDLDENKALQAQLKIQSFPTLIFFKDGVPINFGGSRTKDFMLQWLSKKVQEPIIAVEEARLEALQTDGNVNIVFFGDLKSPQAATLLNIAKNDDYNSTSIPTECTTALRAPRGPEARSRSTGLSASQ